MTTAARPALRAQDMVFTLYGDYLLRRDEPVRAAALVTLLGALGMKPMAVRTTLSRMTRRGWLAAERRGPHSYYRLTARARRLLESGRERIYHPPRARAWDGAWTLIAYSVPETRRRRRDSFRVKLLWLGCGMVSNGLWMTPHDVRRDVAAIAAELGIARNVEVFRARHAGGAAMRALIERCWDLRALDARYAAFLRRWRGGAGRALSPEESFVRRFALVHEYRTFPLADPYLPATLLPPRWHGRTAAALFDRLHAALAAGAERWVREVCRAADAGGRRELRLLRAAS
ncbi:MAG TPA: PaaX family transcriptional regulator C-terminal domain-containing protein [Gemmatimonadaceae bacterium]|nr:PaaX family transcriptional regulator C-terminal domain-containing protein [Gemmatimonadaceae bacterium]